MYQSCIELFVFVCYSVLPVQSSPPTIRNHDDDSTVTVREGQQSDFLCDSSSTGAPTPVLSWSRDTGGDRLPLPVSGTDPLTTHYVPIRSHQDQRLACGADQRTLEAGHGTPVTAGIKINVECKWHLIIISVNDNTSVTVKVYGKHTE